MNDLISELHRNRCHRPAEGHCADAQNAAFDSYRRSKAMRMIHSRHRAHFSPHAARAQHRRNPCRAASKSVT
jgi:hypothetical protein